MPCIILSLFSHAPYVDSRFSHEPAGSTPQSKAQIKWRPRPSHDQLILNWTPALNAVSNFRSVNFLCVCVYNTCPLQWFFHIRIRQMISQLKLCVPGPSVDCYFLLNTSRKNECKLNVLLLSLIANASITKYCTFLETSRWSVDSVLPTWYVWLLIFLVKSS